MSWCHVAVIATCFTRINVKQEATHNLVSILLYGGPAARCTNHVLTQAVYKWAVRIA